MSRQFKREYELTITPTDGESRVITDLRLNFEVKKSILSYPNLAHISIYNPNDETLSTLQRKYTKVTLSAGYQGNQSSVFKGEVRNVLQTKSGVDRVLSFYAGDGERDWQNSFINKTYSESVNIKTIVNDVISTFKETAKGIIEGLPEVADNLMGETLSGSSKYVLDTLANEHGFEWSIQDGEIIITSENEPLSSSQAELISVTTGMVGSPTLTEIGADVTALMNPKLNPKTLFKIESQNADIKMGNLFFRDIKKTSAEGFYVVQEVTHKGDSREGNWLSILRGRSI